MTDCVCICDYLCVTQLAIVIQLNFFKLRSECLAKSFGVSSISVRARHIPCSKTRHGTKMHQQTQAIPELLRSAAESPIWEQDELPGPRVPGSTVEISGVLCHIVQIFHDILVHFIDFV
jgi:hypothetical protein